MQTVKKAEFKAGNKRKTQGMRKALKVKSGRYGEKANFPVFPAFGGLSGTSLTPPLLPDNIAKFFYVTSDVAGHLPAIVDFLGEGREKDRLGERLLELLEEWKDNCEQNIDAVGMELVDCTLTDNYDMIDGQGLQVWELALVFDNVDTMSFECGEKLEKLEAETQGLGQRILSAIDESPCEVYTPASAADHAEMWYWDNYLNDDCGREEEGDEYVSRDDFNNHAPEWAWDCRKRVSLYPKSSNIRLESAITRLEDANRAYDKLRKNYKSDYGTMHPDGYAPAIVMHWKGMRNESGTSIVERFRDRHVDDIQGSFGVNYGRTVFPFDFDLGNVTIEKTFKLAEAYIKCATAVLHLLKIVETGSTLMEIMTAPERIQVRI